MIQEVIEKYNEIFMEDANFNRGLIPQHISDMSKTIAKWRTYLVLEEEKLDKLEEEYNVFYQKKYHFYANDYQFVLDKYRERNLYTDADNEVVELRKQWKEQQRIVEYVKGLVDTITQFPYNVKLYMDWNKFEDGI